VLGPLEKNANIYMSHQHDVCLPDSGPRVKRVELALRWLFGVDPPRRFVLASIWSPNGCATAHDVRAPREPLALVDLGAIGPDIVLNTELHVPRHRWVQTKS